MRALRVRNPVCQRGKRRVAALDPGHVNAVASCGRGVRTPMAAHKAPRLSVGRIRSEGRDGGQRRPIAAECPAGIEPAFPTWKVGTSASRSRAREMVSRVAGGGVEPPSRRSERRIRPLDDPAVKAAMGAEADPSRQSALRESNPPVQLGTLAPRPLGQGHVM